MPINVIFRHIKYSSNKISEEKKNYGNILFETGFSIMFNSDMDMGFLAGASIYSFSLEEKQSAIQQLFFRSKISLKIAL